MHYFFNNMHLISLNKFSDFMQIPNSIRKHPTKDEYFRKHIIFCTINYSKIWLIGIFYEAKLHNMECGQAYCQDLVKSIL
jgi:hypothetical protein